MSDFRVRRSQRLSHWRCGIDIAEVEPRLADALFAIGRALDGHITLAIRTRRCGPGGVPAPDPVCDAAVGTAKRSPDRHPEERVNYFSAGDYDT